MRQQGPKFFITLRDRSLARLPRVLRVSGLSVLLRRRCLTAVLGIRIVAAGPRLPVRLRLGWWVLALAVAGIGLRSVLRLASLFAGLAGAQVITRLGVRVLAGRTKSRLALVVLALPVGLGAGRRA